MLRRFGVGILDIHMPSQIVTTTLMAENLSCSSHLIAIEYLGENINLVDDLVKSMLDLVEISNYVSLLHGFMISVLNHTSNNPEEIL